MRFSDSDLPILTGPPQPTDITVEVCRSFSYKLNLANAGGPAYESADFFASRKQQCDVTDSARVSEEIYQECVAEVRDAVSRFRANLTQKMEAQKQRRSA